MSVEATVDALTIREAEKFRTLPSEDVGMKERWDEAVQRSVKASKNSDGYRKVAVLLIKWEDHINELKCCTEVKELETLFRQGFNYETEIVNLGTKIKPQHQLNSAIANFQKEHDGPNHLLIVYYSGHGMYSENEQSLELSATNTGIEVFGTHMARVHYSMAEQQLFAADGDVLTILDCCYASNLKKDVPENPGLRELLAACGRNELTPKPGKRSFTRTLIDCLRASLVEPRDRAFTTRHLYYKTMELRRETPPFLWDRQKRYDRYIQLAPLPRKSKEEQRPAPIHEPKKDLSLRFTLREPIMRYQQMQALAEGLTRLFKESNIPLHCINWVSLTGPRSKILRSIVHAITAWKRLARRIHRATVSQVPEQDVATSAYHSAAAQSNIEEVHVASGLTSRKRLQEEAAHYELPHKRQETDRQ